MSRYDIRTYGELGGTDRSGLPEQIADQRQRVAERLSTVDRLLAVMSGKGGVGKSFVAAGLAAALGARGGRAGLLDADLSGPTAARMAGVREERLSVSEEGARPPAGGWGGPVVSSDLLLDEDAPLRWRGPESESFVWRGTQEHGMLREFLSDVVWGELDVLVVDLPPGPDRFEQLVGLAGDGLEVMAVTLPSPASGSSVARTLRLAEEWGTPRLGVAENMSGYACPDCGEHGALFPGRAGEELAERFGVPLLGRIPFDPVAAARADAGEIVAVLEETTAGSALRRVADGLTDGREEEE